MQARGGASVIAAGIQDMRQGEEQPGARAVAKLRVGEAALLQGGAVRFRQLAAQQRRQAGMWQGIARLQAQGLAKTDLGLG